jgi:uncharacterized membrane protein
MNKHEHSEGVRSTAAFAGHPIHAMLVPFPFGFLVGALLSDLAYWWLRDPFWARASFWLIVAGVVSGLVAAVFGLIDFLTIRRARHTAGWVHLTGNPLAVLLSLASLVIRLGNPEAAVLPLGLGLSLVVGVILVITGWMGGELAYRYKVGVIGTERWGEEPPAAGAR